MPTVALLILLCAGSVEADVARAVDRSRIARTGLGLIVGEVGGRELHAIAPDVLRTPASNQKILTAALAIRKLGSTFEFRTVFGRDEAGALVVVGDGDPNFSGRFFDGDPNRVMRLLARDLKKNGLAKVTGGIVLDVTRFTDGARHPDWPRDQLDKWYCAPIAALVYNDSCWDITVRPGSGNGAPARVAVEPSLVRPTVQATCTTVTDRARHSVHFGRADGSLRIDGAILNTSQGISGHLTVRDPALFFGRALRAALIAEGIPVEGEVRIGRAGTFKELLVYKSDLRRTLKVMLTKSQNLYAECVLKRAGGGSFETGAAALSRLVEGVEARDGSGMSPKNRVSPRALYRVLQELHDEPVFVEGLAAGGEGTLRRRYRPIGERLRAKTGYIRGVSSLSGYVTAANAKRYVFVVLCNEASVAHARKFQDLLVQAIADSK